MFKRRDRRSWLQYFADSLYPRGGWGRAISYILHRLRRLPDPPHRIARGVFAGVFVTFSPLYGLHFVLAVLLSLTIRGNIVASLLATFVGNPLTFVPIAVVSLQTGHFLLGTEFDPTVERSIFGKFGHASQELWANLYRLVTGRPTNWETLWPFYNEVFLPFLIGGLIPGLISGLIAYYLSAPVVAAYQKRRLSKMREKAEKRLAKRAAKAAARESKDGKRT